jgi:hypothetical protein
MPFSRRLGASAAGQRPVTQKRSCETAKKFQIRFKIVAQSPRRFSMLRGLKVRIDDAAKLFYPRREFSYSLSDFCNFENDVVVRY